MDSSMSISDKQNSLTPMCCENSPIRPLHGCWEKQRKLGQGGCGTVSLALDTKTGFEFAVKSVLCDDQQRDGSAEADLDNELAVLQRVQGCPHALQYLGSDNYVDEQGRTVRLLFLEYMDGGSLQDALEHATKKRKKGGLSEASVRFFARAILEGLQELHQRGVVHCDIKCANVLLRRQRSWPDLVLQQAKNQLSLKTQEHEFEVKLGDFGISREYDPSCLCGGACGQYKKRGTLSHMAPEVVQGRGPCPASDVWSLGCTVAEMLQGSAPWGSGEQALQRQAMAQPPHLPRHLSKPCRDFLQHCLHREPTARWTPCQLLQHPFLQLSAAHAHHHHGIISLHALTAALKKSVAHLGRHHHAHHDDHPDHRGWIAKLLHHHHRPPTCSAATSHQLHVPTHQAAV